MNFIRVSQGFDRGLEVGEAIRRRCVKSQILNINADNRLAVAA